ncbi:MAG: alpha-rhamnosidase, partial [Clostridia bacterium]|nr:alpha-rhamnosidase [Clostridia bacterium]
NFKIYYGESEAEALDKDNCYLTDEVSGNTEYRLKQRAFRYILITPADEALSVTTEYEYLPIERRGAFSCDNKLFCDIFEKSAYTFHLNCREGFFDGIKRDRWIWVADSYISARISRYLFFDKDLEQRTLLGLLGKQPCRENLNTILDYTPLWFIMLYEHFMAYGDKEFLRRVMPEAEKLFAFLETRLNEDGFLEGKDSDWTFLDWADIDKTGAVCAEQMLLIQAYRAMADMKKQLGEPAAVYAEKYETLKKRVNQYYWNSEKGAYIDSFQSGENRVTRHANIFAVMFDIATKEQTGSIVTHVLKNDDIPQIVTPYFKSY